MSSLAPALLDSLSRLLPANADAVAVVQPLITALAAALERGELAIDLEGPAPVELDEGPTWPADHLQALQRCGWLAQADSLAVQPEAPLVQDGRWLSRALTARHCCGSRPAALAR